MSGTANDPESQAPLRARIDELEAENRNLRTALASRIVIEQAKGVLIERLDLPAEDVFELLRSAARRSRRPLRDLATEILKTRVTPGYVEREIRHLVGGNTPASPNPTRPQKRVTENQASFARRTRESKPPPHRELH